MDGVDDHMDIAHEASLDPRREISDVSHCMDEIGNFIDQYLDSTFLQRAGIFGFQATGTMPSWLILVAVARRYYFHPVTFQIGSDWISRRTADSDPKTWQI